MVNILVVLLLESSDEEVISLLKRIQAMNEIITEKQMQNKKVERDLKTEVDSIYANIYIYIYIYIGETI